MGSMIAVGLGLIVCGIGIGIGKIGGSAVDAMARQPEMAGGIRTTLVLGLAFMETLTIYGLLISLMLYAKLG